MKSTLRKFITWSLEAPRWPFVVAVIVAGGVTTVVGGGVGLIAYAVGMLALVIYCYNSSLELATRVIEDVFRSPARPPRPR